MPASQILWPLSAYNHSFLGEALGKKVNHGVAVLTTRLLAKEWVRCIEIEERFSDCVWWEDSMALMQDKHSAQCVS